MNYLIIYYPVLGLVVTEDILNGLEIFYAS
jgi:hypothetical protein